MPYIVYALSDPYSGDIRYIGQTSRGVDRRFAKHKENARLRVKSHLYNWMRSLPTSPLLEIIEECENKSSLDEAEIFYICYFRSLGFDLTNLTNGGDGTVGYRLSIEQRKAIGVRNLGRRASRETRERMSAAHEGHVTSQETRDKIGHANRGRVLSEEQKIGLARAHGSRPFIHLNTGKVYESQASAARDLGLYQSEVREVLIGRRRIARGNRFEYVQG